MLQCCRLPLFLPEPVWTEEEHGSCICLHILTQIYTKNLRTSLLLISVFFLTLSYNLHFCCDSIFLKKIKNILYFHHPLTLAFIFQYNINNKGGTMPPYYFFIILFYVTVHYRSGCIFIPIQFHIHSDRFFYRVLYILHPLACQFYPGLAFFLYTAAVFVACLFVCKT